MCEDSQHNVENVQIVGMFLNWITVLSFLTMKRNLRTKFDLKSQPSMILLYDAVIKTLKY